ncbi:MAG: oligosaccharide flippase family protein [Alistipes sp.]|nr:oligosaccharide flippase family protein [Alistipes sp.]
MNSVESIKEYIKRYRVLVDNFGYLSLLQLCNLIIPLITYPYLVRVLGEETYGTVVYAQAIVAYLAIFVNWGFNISATKSISIYRDDPVKVSQIFSSVYVAKTFFLILVFGVLWLLFLVPEIGRYRALYLLSMWMCVYEWLFPVWYFQGVERMKYIAIFSFVGRLIFVSFIFFVVKSPDDYLWVPIINGVGAIVTSLAAIHIVVNKFSVSFHWPSRQVLLFHTKESTKLLMTSITGIVKDRTNTVIIGSVLGMTEVTYYDFVDKIVNVLSTVFYTISNVLFPYYNRNKNRGFIRKLLLVTSGAGVLIYFGVGAFLKPFVLLFFSSEMLNAIPVYWIMGLLFLARHVSYYLGTVVLISHNYVKEVVVNMVYSMFVYLSAVALFWSCGCLNLYTLALSLVVSVVFEAWHRAYYCSKFHLL